VLLLALGHIQPTFHHELLHRIELAETERLPIFEAWERNRELDGSWRDDCFDPHGRDSGPEDRASCAEVLFTSEPAELRELLEAGDTRAQKLLQLQELYVMVSEGRMSHAWWQQRLAAGE
jgi:hypothetical protein